LTANLKKQFTLLSIHFSNNIQLSIEANRSDEFTDEVLSWISSINKWKKRVKNESDRFSIVTAFPHSFLLISSQSRCRFTHFTGSEKLRLSSSSRRETRFGTNSTVKGKTSCQDYVPEKST
jgi:hypothetical protein